MISYDIIWYHMIHYKRYIIWQKHHMIQVPQRSIMSYDITGTLQMLTRGSSRCASASRSPSITSDRRNSLWRYVFFCPHLSLSISDSERFFSGTALKGTPLATTSSPRPRIILRGVSRAATLMAAYLAAHFPCMPTWTTWRMPHSGGWLSSMSGNLLLISEVKTTWRLFIFIHILLSSQRFAIAQPNMQKSLQLLHDPNSLSLAVRLLIIGADTISSWKGGSRCKKPVRLSLTRTYSQVECDSVPVLDCSRKIEWKVSHELQMCSRKSFAGCGLGLLIITRNGGHFQRSSRRLGPSRRLGWRKMKNQVCIK